MEKRLEWASTTMQLECPHCHNLLAIVVTVGPGVDTSPSPPIDEISVDTLDLSVRAYNCLKVMNLRTVGQVRTLGAPGLLKCKNFGRQSLKNVAAALRQVGSELPGW